MSQFVIVAIIVIIGIIAIVAIIAFITIMVIVMIIAIAAIIVSVAICSCDLRHSSSCDITIPILSALVLVHAELSNFRRASPAVVILARKRLK